VLGWSQTLATVGRFEGQKALISSKNK